MFRLAKKPTPGLGLLLLLPAFLILSYFSEARSEHEPNSGLDQHQDERWRPTTTNLNFPGFSRGKFHAASHAGEMSVYRFHLQLSRRTRPLSTVLVYAGIVTAAFLVANSRLQRATANGDAMQFTVNTDMQTCTPNHGPLLLLRNSISTERAWLEVSLLAVRLAASATLTLVGWVTTVGAISILAEITSLISQSFASPSLFLSRVFLRTTFREGVGATLTRNCVDAVRGYLPRRRFVSFPPLTSACSIFLSQVEQNYCTRRRREYVLAS